MPPLTYRRKELSPFFEHPLGLFHRGQHLLDGFENVARTEIKAAIETLDRAINFVVAETRISDRALLIARLVEQRIDRQESILGHVVEQLGARGWRCQRDLDRFAIHLAREPDRFLDRFLALARQTQDESAMNQDPELVTVLGETP